MEEYNNENKLNEKTSSDSTKVDGRLALTVDWDKYANYLDNSDLAESEKREFLEALWSIVVNFVDLGFQINPVQQVCGQELQISKLPKTSPDDVLKWKDHKSQNAFSKAVGHRRNGSIARPSERKPT